jgi:cysteine desulfurase/selenocysteine lyase
MFDANKYRQDFSILNKPDQKLVYFDNACMSLKPRQVLEAMTEYYAEYPACAGRSSHRLSELATKAHHQARTSVARFLNAKLDSEIIFTRNTTESINLIANCLNLKAGDVVLTTDKEHNSNLVPWLLLAKRRGIVHRVLPSLADNTFDLEAYREAVKGVKLVSMVLTSNLDGVSIPAKEIIDIAHENGSLVLLDSAQAVLHQKIDVQGLGVDFLALSGHKMVGPTGTGVLYGKMELLDQLEPFLVGGDTVSGTTYDSYELLPVPERFEAGLQDYAGIIGLGAAAEYLMTLDWPALAEHEAMLNAKITEIITASPKVKIIGPGDSRLRSGVISFYIPGFDSHQIALMMDQMAGVMMRSGQHCVHAWFNAHGIATSARASVAFYNNLEDVEIFKNTFEKIIKIL